MAENDVFYYGFILFCNPKTPEKTPFIGSKVSATVKYKGNVKFKVDQLNIKNYQPGRYFYLVKYTLLPGHLDRLERMEIVRAFEKNQYPGTLSVDGLGSVSFKKNGSNEEIVISGSNIGEVVNEVKDPVAQLSTPRQAAPKQSVPKQETPGQITTNPSNQSKVETAIASLNFLEEQPLPELEWKRNEKGHEVVSFLVPYELIYGDKSMDEYKFGIVNYFVTSISTYVRERFTNHLYCQEENGAEVGIFSSQEEAPNVEKVGRINTGKFLYFVLYKEAGYTVENPVKADSQLPKVTDVHFLWRIQHKKVEKIIPEEKGVRVSMIVERLMKAVVRETDLDLLTRGTPMPGQSVETYMNKLVTVALQAGEVNKALEILENHKDELTFKQYQEVRFRLLPRVYKDTRSEESRLANIECIDALLPYVNDTSQINFRMTLLLEKANKHIQGQELETAEIALREWLQNYSTLIENSPEQEKGFRLSHTKVMKGLKICAGEELGDFDVIAEGDQDDDDDRIGRVIDDSFIIEAMSTHSCGVFGKEYEIFDDLSALSDEDDHGLKKFLEEHKNAEDIKSAKELWAIARIYWMLQASPMEIVDDEDAVEREIRFIERALKEEAISKAITNERRAEVRKAGQVNWGELSALFYMDKLLAMHVDEYTLAATIGSFCLSPSNLTRAINREIDFLTMLRHGRFQNSLGIMVKALVILCSQYKEVKELFKNLMTDENEDEGSLLEFVIKRLNELGGSNDISLDAALESAVKDYERFCRGISQLSNPVSVSDLGKEAILFIDDSENIRWLEQDVVYISSLRDCFKYLRDYDKATNFAQKAECVTRSMENMHQVTDNVIQSHPSILSYTLLNPLLERVNEKLIYVYKALCQNTRPTIKIDGCEAVDIDGDTVILNIPVTIEKGINQDATEVVLFVKDCKDFTCDVKRKFLGSSIPSDGRTIHTSVEVKLKNENITDTSLRVRIQFNYISDVKIQAERSRFGDRRHRLGRHFVERYRSKDVRSTVFLPGPDESAWVSLDVNLKQNKNKRMISTERIKKFPGDGQMDFRDPDIVRILDNRKRQIDDVIDAVTMIVKDEEGNDRRVLTNMGRWAILYGQWRVGKSVILNCVHEKLSNQEDYPHGVVIHLELSGSDQENFENFFARKIFLSLAQALNDHEDGDEYYEILDRARSKYGLKPSASDIDWETMEMVMAEFNSGIRKLYPRAATVLLVDEFTEIYKAIIRGNAGERFPARWTSFINTTKFLCVTAGGEHTVSLMETYAPNTLQKATSKIPVRYLTEKDVDIYVHYVMGEAPEDHVPKEDSYFANNSDEAVGRIYDLTRGNAYLLMNLCTWIIDYLNYCREQGLVRNLTTNLINEAIIFFIERCNMGASKLVAYLFNSLYNPFNEAEEGESVKEGVTRIEDDQVCRVNKEILETIVRYADTNNHKCSYSDLTTKIPGCGQGDFDRVYKKAFDTLINRGILKMDDNKNVQVFIDLYYEIVNYMDRSGSKR